MSGGPGDLYDLCREYLEACGEAVVTAPGGPINRTFVSPGLPAFDCCPQLTVHAGGPAEGDTAPLQPPLQPGQRYDVGAVHLVAMTATVIRCVPGVETEGTAVVIPTPAEIDAASRLTLGDLWAIWNHCLNRIRAGSLFPAPGGKREVFFDPAVAVVTSGGCAGWQIQVRVQLGGYREEGS